MKKIILLLLGVNGLFFYSNLFAYSGYYAPYEGTRYITQGWDGGYSHGNARNGSPHSGKKLAYALDIGGNNFNVLATKDGEVIAAGWHNGFGNYVVVKHNDGLYSLYAHLNKIEKRSGYVNRGALLGKSGNTGSWSEGAHLHFQLNTTKSLTTDMGHSQKVDFQGFSISDVNYINLSTKKQKTSKNHLYTSSLAIYKFWIKQGTIYTNSKFDAQFKLKNNSSEEMEVSAIALSLHDSNHQHKKDFKVDYGVYIGAGQSYSTGFSEITTPSEAGIYYVVAKYQKDNGEWVDLDSQKIIIKENSVSNIDRAEALKLILDKFEISTKNAGFNSSRFGEPITLPSDVTTSTDNYNAIVVGYNRGITNGEDGKFYPTRKVSLQEFVIMIVRTIPIPLDNPNYNSFSYADSNNAFYKYLKAAYNAKILEDKSYNFEDGVDESIANSLLNKAFEYFRGSNSGISIYLKWNTQYVDLDMYAYSPVDSSNIQIEKNSDGYIINMEELNTYNNLLYYGNHSTNWGANLDYDSWGGNGNQPWTGFGEERATVDSLMVKRPGTYSFIVCYYDWRKPENPSSASYEIIGYQGIKNITQNGSISGTIDKNMCKVGGTLTTR